MKRCAVACVAGLLSVSACKNTRQGIEADGRAAGEAAAETAQAARRKLDGEVEDFKREAGAELERLQAAMAKLEDRAEEGVDDSKRKLQRRIDETRAKLAEVKAASRAEWESTRDELHDRLADIGKQINATLDEVGDSVEDGLE
jgi:DNA anti-recombination protein RmuC